MADPTSPQSQLSDPVVKSILARVWQVLTKEAEASVKELREFTLPFYSNVLLMGALLAAIAMIGFDQLPAGLATVVGGVGTAALSDLLNRLRKGGVASDEELLRTLKVAIADSGVAQLLTQEEFRREVDRLLNWELLVFEAVREGNDEIVGSIVRMRAWLNSEIGLLATREQAEQLQATVDQLRLEVASLRGQAGPIMQVLHQLPPSPADFLGREAELQELLDVVGRGGTTIVGLRGMGGVGKTVLALVLAERLKLRYPDGQIYLDLKGFDPRPVTPVEAMTHVVRSFHSVASLPKNEAELVGLYRSVLSGQRVLLVMDNASNAEQLEILIPPITCLLLVTSRRHIVLPGLYTKSLEVLSPIDAKTLLLKVSPRLGEHAEAIARLCDYLPFSLRLAGSAFSKRLTLQPEEYSAHLAETHHQLGLIDGVLKTSYELLDEVMRQRWRLLGVFPDSFDVPAAAAVWETTLDSAQEGLDTLIEYSLIQWDQARWHGSLHDLARAFANAHQGTEERERAEWQHAEYFIRFLRYASKLYEQGGTEMLLGLAMIDYEWKNIQAGQSWAAMRAPTDARAARLCADYPEIGAQPLFLRLSSQEQIQWREAGLAAARQLGDRRAEAANLNGLGTARAIRGELEKAIAVYKQSVTLALEIGDRRGEGASLGNLGHMYFKSKKPIEAFSCYDGQLTIALELGDRHQEASARLALGQFFLAINRVSQAIEYSKRALAMTRQINNRHAEGMALLNLGNIYRLGDDVHEAITYYESALTIFTELRDWLNAAQTAWSLGWAYEKEGNLSHALELIEWAIDRMRQASSADIVDIEQKAADLESLRARLHQLPGQDNIQDLGVG